MDCIDERLLNLIQEGIPLEERPFKSLGDSMSISEAEVIDRIKRLMELKYIRKFGGFFDSRKLGYKGTLCAMKAPVDRVEEVAEVINSYDEITHNYLRDGEYNLWFTVLSEDENKLVKVIDQIKEKTKIDNIISLPSKKLYKVKTAFKVGDVDA